MEDKDYTVNKEKVCGCVSGCPNPSVTTIYIGKYTGVQICVDKKFNWFQKKMIKWCFGFEVKENSNDA
jgi:hypothetical protein